MCFSFIAASFLYNLCLAIMFYRTSLLKIFSLETTTQSLLHKNIILVRHFYPDDCTQLTFHLYLLLYCTSDSFSDRQYTISIILILTLYLCECTPKQLCHVHNAFRYLNVVQCRLWSVHHSSNNL